MAGPVHLTLCYRLQAPANWVPRRSAVAGECAASATRRTLSEELADAILSPDGCWPASSPEVPLPETIGPLVKDFTGDVHVEPVDTVGRKRRSL
jgi:hypothetical protein